MSLPRHSGAARSAEPGIQQQTLCLYLDSGFARAISAFTRVFDTLWRSRPGMTGRRQYVAEPSMTALSWRYSSQSVVPQISFTFCRKSSALSLLPCSACHMP